MIRVLYTNWLDIQLIAVGEPGTHSELRPNVNERMFFHRIEMSASHHISNRIALCISLAIYLQTLRSLPSVPVRHHHAV